jgi:hypothetical protein
MRSLSLPAFLLASATVLVPMLLFLAYGASILVSGLIFH